MKISCTDQLNLKLLVSVTAVAVLSVVGLVLVVWSDHGRVHHDAEPLVSEPAIEIQEDDTTAPWPWTESRRAPEIGADVPSVVYPEEVLNNPECRIQYADGVAVVLLPERGGARFAIVDAIGVRHTEHLAFVPKKMSMARRTDGSVLAAFGDLVREDPGRPGPEASWPVSIYLDGQQLVESDPIWNFGVAGDGSSYYLIEPLAGDTSQLIIRNLDERSERVHFLDEMATSYASGELPYSVFYSRDDSEIRFQPGIDGEGTHYFYPAKGARRERREIRLPEAGQDGEPIVISASFPSSEEGFVTYWIDSERFLLVAYQRDWNSKNHRAVERWSRAFRRPDSLPYHMSLSGDGTVLLLRGFTVHLLDANTGQTRFAMPIVDEVAQLERLRGVLGVDATSAQIGSVSQVDLVGSQLYLARRFKSQGRWSQNRAYDVYNLHDIRIDSPPSERISLEAGAPECSSEATSGRLRSESGQLVFAPAA